MSRRAPKATRPARIAALPNLPLFHQIRGRRVVVAGSGEGAAWKAELLSAAGATVHVLAGGETEAARFAALASEPVSGPVIVEPRTWQPADLDYAAVVVGDIADDREAARFCAAARERGIPVNLIDRPDLCDVQVGTIVNRNPVVLAISTDGAAPMLGQSIRSAVESVLPLGLSGWARAARLWRRDLRARLADFADRRTFWQRFTERAWAHSDRAPTEADRAELIRGVEASPRPGSVFLVGAGPGDPELLTLKAMHVLRSATVILYDDLVGPEILELARREAVRIAVGKRGHRPSVGQAEICGQLIALAKAGETVVRLKGGDPLIFGRAAEELNACRAAGVEVTIVPGISAAQGAAAALGISLTERLTARRVQYATGHGADGALPSDLDWRAIADPGATTVIYMPRRTLSDFVARAVEAGLDPATPAAAVASATRPDQAYVAGAIGELSTLLAVLDPAAPVTIIMGSVARAIRAGVRAEAAAKAA